MLETIRVLGQGCCCYYYQLRSLAREKMQRRNTVGTTLVTARLLMELHFFSWSLYSASQTGSPELGEG